MPQGPFQDPPLLSHKMPYKTSFGISGRFQPLSPGTRWVIHVLLTLPPLKSSCPLFRSTCMPHPHCQRSIWTKIKFSRKILKNLIDLLIYIKKISGNSVLLQNFAQVLNLLVHRLFTTVKTSFVASSATFLTSLRFRVVYVSVQNNTLHAQLLANNVHKKWRFFKKTII